MCMEHIETFACDAGVVVAEYDESFGAPWSTAVSEKLAFSLIGNPCACRNAK